MEEQYKSLGKVRPTIEGYWDKNKEYDIISIVYDNNSDKSYISKQYVPKNIALSNAKYWQLFGNTNVSYDSIIFLGFNNKNSVISYSLKEALEAIPEDKKRIGIFVSFYESPTDILLEDHWNLYQFSSNDISEFYNEKCWISVYYNKYTTIILQGAVTVGPNGNWFNNGEDSGIKAQGEPGPPGIAPILRWNNNSIEQSVDNGNTWSKLSGTFTDSLYIKGYVDSVDNLPTNALIGDMYGVGPYYTDDDESHSNPYYQMYVNTITSWIEKYTITKIYISELELPATEENNTIVLVKRRSNCYLIYEYVDGWNLIANLDEIYLTKNDIINKGDNIYALVMSKLDNEYILYERVVEWVDFGTFFGAAGTITASTFSDDKEYNEI